jgi:mRNA-degrading endonuclease toxin of MazEF toxin-antitoxin module
VERVNRGDVWEHPLRGRQFVVISTQRLNENGTVIVAEIAGDVPSGTRGMLAVQLGADDPVPGAVIAYRVNWQMADRMAEWKLVGRLSDATMDVVAMALRTSMDL